MGYEARPLICRVNVSPDPSLCGRKEPPRALIPCAMVDVEVAKKYRRADARAWTSLLEALRDSR